MKICYFNSDFLPNLGGMASVAVNLADFTSKNQEVENVTVISFNNSEPRREIKNNLVIYAFKSRFLPSVFVLTCYYVWKFRKFDVFHATDLFPIGFFVVLIAGKILRKKVFISVYGTDALSKKGLRITRKLKSWSLKKCHKIFTISNSSCELISDFYNIDKKRFAIIPPGLDYSVLNSNPEDIRKKYNLKDDDFIVLSVGRLIKRKGFADLIKAISLITDQSVKLMIVGAGEEDDNLKKLVNELNLSSRVIFAGKVSQVADYYYSANVFSMPSKHLEGDGDVEGLGLVYLEAQYFGLPVVGTRSGGIPEALIEGETGLLANESDPQDLAEKIMQLKNNQELYSLFKTKAVEFIKNNFLWDVIAKKMINQYSQANRIIAILRIKNEIAIIDECLSRLSELVDEILVVDNDSSDGTQNIYLNYPKVKEVIRTEDFNEGRDKIILLEQAKKRNPDWIIFLDADEIFEKNFTRKELEKYMTSGYDRISFRLCHFWLDRKRCRFFDKKYFLYSLQPLRCMWKNKEEVYFLDQVIHNGDVMGDFKKVYFSPYRLKHFSLIDRDKMLEKINLYKSIDKSPRNYDHMHPEIKYFTYPFWEFNNHFINTIFIIINKYLFHLMWLSAIIFLRIKKKIKK
jgi:phosphatidyl-myo-inositol dimannoside synthase